MSNNRAIEFMERIRLDIFDRMRRGELRYETDMETLRKHLQLAQEMNSPLMVGRIYNMMGIVGVYVGKISDALHYYDMAFRVFDDMDDVAQMGKVKNNLGELYREIGQYEYALVAYQEARDWLSQVDDKVTLPLLESNMGLMWLAMGEYEQAEAHFSVVIILIAERTWEQIDALMQARLGMAEVNLERGNLAQAWENIEEAYRLASGKRNTLSLVEINLTRAHIAAADPNTPESAAAYHALSRRELAGHHSPIVLARSLMQEARYQQRHGNLDAAYQLAQEAYEIFAQQGALEEMQLAETLIQP